MRSTREMALGHAWAYFELHATQRITTFNYFVVFSGILATGLAATIQGPQRLAVVGIALGLLITLLSFLFWQLDRRTSFLIKHAEASIRSHEPENAKIVADEAQKSRAAQQGERLWTYGQVFRAIFATMALVGVGGAAICGLRWSGQFDWDADVSNPQCGQAGISARATSGADPPNAFQKATARTLE